MRLVDDRPAAAPTHAFEEVVIEATETAEEPVIAKEARVVEEVVVSKDVTERSEAVSDRVRRTDVEPEARRRWEARNEGPWAPASGGIREAWERARGRRPLPPPGNTVRESTYNPPCRRPGVPGRARGVGSCERTG